MLRLNLKTEPYWMDLPGKVKVKVRPVSTAIMSAAQSIALEQYRKLMEEKGLDGENDAMRKGISESILVKSLAGLAIIEWDGVLQADGEKPAAISEKTISDLMDIWVVAQDFLQKYVTQVKILETEGNSSAPAVSGTSAEEARTAKGAA